ncbi:Site-specific recombinase XerC [Caballeronia sordidicola]|uniref:Site-specific recombinase XerC n=1 Tax=Caballeronia sordidicola TaxID=196367 RepID=A0A242MYM6_CABSO|nr:Site-specific recombinase XerC [Caballeronia sordidicola]
MGEFFAWCGQAGVISITEVQPLHVAAWIEAQTRTLSSPSVKQHLAAIRHLFDWLVVGQVVRTTRPRPCADRVIQLARARPPCWMRPKPGSCSTASMSPHPLASGIGR